MIHSKRRQDKVFLLLAGLFIANAILGELIGGKLIEVGGYLMSIGVIPWPVVFILTDLMNEYFGRDGVRKITFITAGLIIYVFLVLLAAMQVPAAPVSAVSDGAFREVFGQSMWIIAGSLIAFLASQLVDVMVFWVLKKRTGGRLLWLRATGSTAVSQIIDTFVILGIAFWLPGKLGFADFMKLGVTNYSYKLLIAILVTPLIYWAHSAIDRYLGEEISHSLISEAEYQA